MTLPQAEFGTGGGPIFRIGRVEDRESLQLRSSIESSPYRGAILEDSASTALAPELLETGRVEDRYVRSESRRHGVANRFFDTDV
jgi:hypothetical protein